MKKCVKCGSRKFKNAVYHESRKVAGIGIESDLPATMCTNCKETYVDGEAGRRMDLWIAISLAHTGVLSGEIFRFVRKAVGVPASQLAELLGVDVATISRWETGKGRVDRASLAALTTMATDSFYGRRPAAEEVLRALISTRKPPRVLKFKPKDLGKNAA